MQAPSPLPVQPLSTLLLTRPPPSPQAAALSSEGEKTLLQFFAVKDTPSSEEIRFLARHVRTMPAVLLTDGVHLRSVQMPHSGGAFETKDADPGTTTNASPVLSLCQTSMQPGPYPPLATLNCLHVTMKHWPHMWQDLSINHDPSRCPSAQRRR